VKDECPEPLQWVLRIVTGMEWPEADTDALTTLAGQWQDMARTLQRLTEEGQRAAEQVRSAERGSDADAFSQWWDQQVTPQGGGSSPVDSLQQSVAGAGEMLSQFARSVKVSRYSIIAQLAWLAGELVAAQAAAPFTFGASEAAAAVATAAARMTVTQIFKMILRQIVEQAVKQAVLMAGINVFAQLATDGHVDWGEVGQSAESGAIGGAVGGALGGALGGMAKNSPAVARALGSLPGKVVVGAGTGVAGAAATDAIMNGGVNPNDLLGGALGGVGGAAHGHLADGIREHAQTAAAQGAARNLADAKSGLPPAGHSLGAGAHEEVAGATAPSPHGTGVPSGASAGPRTDGTPSPDAATSLEGLPNGPGSAAVAPPSSGSAPGSSAVAIAADGGQPTGGHPQDLPFALDPSPSAADLGVHASFEPAPPAAMRPPAGSASASTLSAAPDPARVDGATFGPPPASPHAFGQGHGVPPRRPAADAFTATAGHLNAPADPLLEPPTSTVGTAGSGSPNTQAVPDPAPAPDTPGGPDAAAQTPAAIGFTAPVTRPAAVDATPKDADALPDRPRAVAAGSNAGPSETSSQSSTGPQHQDLRGEANSSHGGSSPERGTKAAGFSPLATPVQNTVTRRFVPPTRYEDLPPLQPVRDPRAGAPGDSGVLTAVESAGIDVPTHGMRPAPSARAAEMPAAPAKGNPGGAPGSAARPEVPEGFPENWRGDVWRLQPPTTSADKPWTKETPQSGADPRSVTGSVRQPGAAVPATASADRKVVAPWENADGPGGSPAAERSGAFKAGALPFASGEPMAPADHGRGPVAQDVEIARLLMSGDPVAAARMLAGRIDVARSDASFLEAMNFNDSEVTTREAFGDWLQREQARGEEDQQVFGALLSQSVDWSRQSPEQVVDAVRRERARQADAGLAAQEQRLSSEPAGLSAAPRVRQPTALGWDDADSGPGVAVDRPQTPGSEPVEAGTPVGPAGVPLARPLSETFGRRESRAENIAPPVPGPTDETAVTEEARPASGGDFVAPARQRAQEHQNARHMIVGPQDGHVTSRVERAVVGAGDKRSARLVGKPGERDGSVRAPADAERYSASKRSIAEADGEPSRKHQRQEYQKGLYGSGDQDLGALPDPTTEFAPLDRFRDHASPEGHLRVPPRYADALRAVVPKDEAGMPVQFADPRAYVSKINAEGPRPGNGRDLNCVDAVMAFHATWRGDPQVAAAVHGGAEDIGTYNRLQEWSNGFLAPVGRGQAAFEDVAATLRQQGHGSAALIVHNMDGQGEHAWNVVNYQGEILCLDPQRGTWSTEPDGLLPQDGLEAIVLDPHNEPVGVGDQGVLDGWVSAAQSAPSTAAQSDAAGPASERRVVAGANPAAKKGTRGKASQPPGANLKRRPQGTGPSAGAGTTTRKQAAGGTFGKGGHSTGAGLSPKNHDEMSGSHSAPPVFNSKFEERVRQNQPRELQTADYLEYVNTSVAAARKPAFVVNAMVGHAEVADILKVLHSMRDGMKGMDDRVGIVIGVNARKGDADSLEKALESARRQVAGYDLPVALVPSTFGGAKKGFPYGRLRNEVLHSEATQGLIRTFMNDGYHPYIAVQDFDLGSRLVPSGLHVFNHFHKLLDAPEDLAAPPPKEGGVAPGLEPSRPLMMAGGYRLPDGEHRAILEAAIRARFDNAGKSTAGLFDTDREKNALFKRLEEKVSQDMWARDRQAGIAPLLPYAPEPNLFFDGAASLLKTDEGSWRIEFGSGGAEFKELAQGLNRLNAWELQQRYEQDASGLRMYAPPGTDQAQLKALREQIKADAANNRIPIRGEAFVTDFRGGATVTDLSRLAYELLTKGYLPQDHSGLSSLNRYFDSHKTVPAVKGKLRANVEEFRNGFKPGESYEPLLPSHPRPSTAPIDPEQQLDAPGGYADLPPKTRTQLGIGKLPPDAQEAPGSEELPMMDSVSASLGGVLGDVQAGLPKTLKAMGVHELGLTTPELHFGRQLQFVHSQDLGGELRNTVYNAVSSAEGGNDSSEAALGIRSRVTEWALRPQNLNLIMKSARESGADLDDVFRGIGSGIRGGLAKGSLASRILASGLGARLVIRTSTAEEHTAEPLEPLPRDQSGRILIVDLTDELHVHVKDQSRDVRSVLSGRANGLERPGAGPRSSHGR
jgi:hypothetical protein